MEHQWCAFIVYRLDEATAEKLFSGPEGPPITFSGAPPVDTSRATLTAEMVDQKLSNVGCVVCEKQWSAAHGTPCPGEPIGYSSTGEPIHKEN